MLIMQLDFQQTEICCFTAITQLITLYFQLDSIYHLLLT